MSLQVLGSGFGRTGTKSLKEALERIGFGPCHHMYEVVANPPQVAHWQELAAGGAVDWAEVFAGYRAQVDWPGALVWRELAEAFPEARIVHTMRPEALWWSSFEKTIARLIARHYRTMPLPPHVRDMMAATETLLTERTFRGPIDDRETALAAYRRRADEVREAIPANRLLIFDVAEGWGPLCAFLGVAAPEEPFPHRNQNADFWDALGGEPV